MSKDGAWGFDKPEEKEGQRIQEFTVDKDDPRLDLAIQLYTASESEEHLQELFKLVATVSYQTAYSALKANDAEYGMQGYMDGLGALCQAINDKFKENDN